MNVLPFYFCGYVFTAAIIMGHCELQAASTTSSQAGESPSDFIGFASAPDKVAYGSVVRVRYRCSGPCQLAVEVVVSTLRETDLAVFRRKWIGSTSGVYRIHQVPLGVPPSILYQHDFFNRRVLRTLNVTVRAWLDHLDDGGEPGTYRDSTVRVYKELQVEPLSERPAKPPTECPSWSAQLVWQTTRNRVRQCPHESDVIDVLKFPLASPGEHFGVVRRFQPFIDRALESARLRAVTQPSVTLSVWVYLLKWCQGKLCGIVHHVGRKRAYDSVLLQLTDTGDVIIQTRVTTGEDKAFRANVALPRWKWIRLDCYIQDSKVLLDATWDDKTRRYQYQFQHSVHYDDTDGYFVIGGSGYMPGIHGYFGPIKYYRFGTEKVENHLESTSQELDRTHQECQEVKALTQAFLKEVTESHDTTVATGACTPYFTRLRGPSREKVCTQTWTWEEQLKHSTLFHLLQTKKENIRTGSLSMKELRSVLFDQAVGTMFTVDQEQNKVKFGSTALLQISSCIGNHKASLLLAAVFFSGLGHPVDQQQGHVYSLIGALGDNRFALMHAGYKHQQGIDGFPKDLDVAYSYYSNVGAQSIVDSSRIHENVQHPLELIYLSNKEDLNSFTEETSDVFHYLKYRAENGDVESQKHLGTMLFWGRHGVPKDVATAVKWYERSALQLKDPTAMYDYSVLLMKGQGVKKNVTRGLKLLEKAAAMGSVNALNGLGWYYRMILNDHEKAVKYFRQAALNGSADAIFNLGLYHLSHQNPDDPRRNETAAVLQFLNASRLGHDAASVEAASYLSTGVLEGVSQDVVRAVTMVKKVCDQNGHLGLVVRDALRGYIRGSRQGAFVKYVLAAEAGLALAQSNAAHLCEELDLHHDCQWRYHNFSILNYDPHPAALLKMGDHHYSSSSRRGDSLWSPAEAVSMYVRAAAAGSPQGMFNLVLLAEQGHVVLASIHSMFNESQRDEQDVLLMLLKRCVQAEEEEAVMPCSLALLRVQMGRALRRTSQSGAQLLLTYASLLSVIVTVVIVPLQSCLEQRVASRRVFAPRASSVSQGGVGSVTEQDGVVGGAHGAAGNPNGERQLLQTCDWAVSLSGVCLCAFCTAILSHLL
ncbi:protein sel-1 homolog 3 [Anarhichas minor]|uniref:protein sel-1 homolog 3 n=1 Tax=Anarhichas minor TaxID=65739 RepID=UPI003F740C2E